MGMANILPPVTDIHTYTLYPQRKLSGHFLKMKTLRKILVRGHHILKDICGSCPLQIGNDGGRCHRRDWLTDLD